MKLLINKFKEISENIIFPMRSETSQLHILKKELIKNLDNSDNNYRTLNSIMRKHNKAKESLYGRLLMMGVNNLTSEREKIAEIEKTYDFKEIIIEKVLKEQKLDMLVALVGNQQLTYNDVYNSLKGESLESFNNLVEKNQKEINYKTPKKMKY